MKNEALELLLNRRSIRKYKPEQITDEELDALVKVAVNTPSHRNTRRYHFTVIQDKELIQRMSKLIRNIMLNSGDPSRVEKAKQEGYCPFFHAPTVIFVSGELDKSFHVHTDCGIAVGNIVAAATVKGLGTCIVASSLFMFDCEEGKEIKELLGIPENYRAICSISVGYPDGPTPEPPETKENLVNYIR